MKTLFIGCDISKKNFEATLRADDVEQSIGTFKTNPHGYGELRKAFDKFNKADYQIHLIAEPTGTYHLGFIAYAYEQEWEVSLPNPVVIRQWAKGQGVRIKTDKIDAHTLAAYGFKEQPAAENSLPTHVEELDLMLKRKDDIKKSLRQEKNRLESYVHRTTGSDATHQSILDAIAFYGAQLLEIQAAIKSYLKQHQDLAKQRTLLSAVPGMGEQGVLKILVFLYRWDARTASLGNANGLVAFAGLDPALHSSSTSVYRRPTISKMGDSEIRRTLYMSAFGGMKAKSSPLVDFCQRLLERDKPNKVALVAGARKILVWAFAVFRSGLPFDNAKAMPKSL